MYIVRALFAYLSAINIVCACTKKVNLLYIYTSKQFMKKALTQ